MSIKVMTWVWDHSRSSKSDRLVLLAIADCAADNGGNAYPSNTELMRKTGLSSRGVQLCIKNLVGLGELRVTRNGGPSGCNRYRITMTPAVVAPPADSAPPQPVHPPAKSAPRPPQPVRQTPATSAPGTVLEPSVEPSVELLVGKTAEDGPGRPDVERVCTRLADRIAANGSKRPKVTRRWRTAARLLLDIDGRTVEQVERAIDWCQADSFWRGNVLSMPKLRERYDQLRLAAQREGARASPPPSTVRHIDDLSPEQRAARNPFAGAVRASEVTRGAS